ncbi:HAAS signaling domain-containing protein [Guptibacillus algicola]|uniref:HAAS signaling domain-containing protein n=1 Tax=Guptibacillus algicola TaxID=225844 RepID=UPI001CD4350B|nr:hypothetical protein [Alkalihalobacillus algicola]MCA0987483.1 hypothetical protein [Alkalihalobacillus algicola]
MRLIEAYIGEVTRRLPEKEREDIALELRSTIYDTLPEDYSEEDVKDTLSELGSPFMLANGYKNWPMHLIGPNYFESYVSLLKLILPIALLISFLSLLTVDFIEHSGALSLMSIFWITLGNAFVVFFEVTLQVLFWVTLGFVILERTEHKKETIKKWSPDDLKKSPSYLSENAVTKKEVFWDLFWTAAITALYFNASNLIGVMKDGEMVAPFFNNDVLLSYWPLVVAAVVGEVLLAGYKLFRGVWTKPMALLNALQLAFSTTVFLLIVFNKNILHSKIMSYFPLPERYIERSLTITALIVVAIVIIEAWKGFKRVGQARA